MSAFHHVLIKPTRFRVPARTISPRIENSLNGYNGKRGYFFHTDSWVEIYSAMSAYFDLPLNLPHAGRIALRICRLIESRAFSQNDESAPGNLVYLRLSDAADRLEGILRPYCESGDDPPESEAIKTEQVRQEAARLGRALAEGIAGQNLHDDRLGQCVRNLFECLGLGKEGAERGLQAGENPHSLQRP